MTEKTKADVSFSQHSLGSLFLKFVTEWGQLREHRQSGKWLSLFFTSGARFLPSSLFPQLVTFLSHTRLEVLRPFRAEYYQLLLD